MENKSIRLTGGCQSHLRVLREADGGTGRTIEGYAIVFGQESAVLWTERDVPCVEVISEGAITKELLDRSNIKMTMYHDFGRMLARSKEGEGSLSYEVDSHGVKFRFEAPETQYGDEAIALVDRGDIDGCSFMFATDYGDRECVSREKGEGKIVYRVNKVAGVYDFTLTPDPAYPQTECALRSQAWAHEAEEKEEPKDEEKMRAQVQQMRRAARDTII